MLRATLLNAVVTVAGALLALARSKIAAQFLGPDGFGVAAVMNQWVQLFSVAASMVTGPALIGALSRRPSPEERASVLKTAGLFIVAVNLVATGAAIVSERAASGRSDAPVLLALSGLTSIFTTLAAVPQAALIVENALGRMTRLVLIGSVVSTALIALGTVSGGLLGQFIGATAGGAATLGLFWYAQRATLDTGNALTAPVSVGFVKLAASLGATSLIAGFAVQAALTSIRLGLERTGGSEANGLFQAAWGLNATAFAVLTGGLANYAFPRFGAAQTPQALSEEMRTALRFVMKLVFPVAMLGLALHDVALPVLFSRKFEGAAPLIALLAAGNVPRAAVWVTSGPLMYRGKVIAFLALELIAALALGLATPALLPTYGLTAVGFVYFTNATLQLLLSAITIRVVERASLSWAGLLLVAVQTALTLFVALTVTSHLGVRLAALAVGVTLLAREGRRLKLPWTNASSRTSAASRS